MVESSGWRERRLAQVPPALGRQRLVVEIHQHGAGRVGGQRQGVGVGHDVGDDRIDRGRVDDHLERVGRVAPATRRPAHARCRRRPGASRPAARPGAPAGSSSRSTSLAVGAHTASVGRPSPPGRAEPASEAPAHRAGPARPGSARRLSRRARPARRTRPRRAGRSAARGRAPRAAAGTASASKEARCGYSRAQVGRRARRRRG